MGQKEDYYCELCENNVSLVDAIVHYFIECDYVQGIWRNFSKWSSETTELGYQQQTHRNKSLEC